MLFRQDGTITAENLVLEGVAGIKIFHAGWCTRLTPISSNFDKLRLIDA